jgi:hypothetical protein
MRTRLTWLAIGAALAVFVTQAWAKTLSAGTASNKARSYASESIGGTIRRTVEFVDRPQVSPVRCVRGLASGDPADPSGPPYVPGTSVHRFDCAARVRRDGRWDGFNSSGYVRPPSATTNIVRVVVTMRHHRNALGQASYPVSVRRANCSVDRCVDP